MNMEYWMSEQIAMQDKKPMPLISYPSIQLMFINIERLVKDSRAQAMGIALLAEKYDMPFASSYMDLSIEAEAFGANCVYKPDEIPTITGPLIEDEEGADALVVPEVGAGRTGIALEGVKKALMLVKDRPVFANCIGPFSLAGRLMDVNEVLLMTLDEPETVHKVLEKATEFIIKYIKAYKDIGANGIIMAEPLAGLLSPALMQEFSTDYCKRIIDEVQDKDFLVCYHNCSNAIERKIEAVKNVGAKMYHFGDKADMVAMLDGMPNDVIIMGNISPSAVFKADSSQKMALDTQELLLKCYHRKNFMISSGCDIPADTSMENIDKFFWTVRIGYHKQKIWEIIS